MLVMDKVTAAPLSAIVRRMVIFSLRVRRLQLCQV